MADVRVRAWRWMIVVAIAGMILGTQSGASFAQSGPPESSTVMVHGWPDEVATEGEPVRFSLEVYVPDGDRPATVTAITSDIHGDVTDPANPLAIDTNCSVPSAWETTPGWGGWACWYETTVGGAPGTVANTISVTLVLQDGSEVVVSDTSTTTVSDELGVIAGRAIDADSGDPIPGLWILGGWGPAFEEFGSLTDADGRFRYPGLPAGTYAMRSGAFPPGAYGLNPPPGYSTPYAEEWFDTEPEGVDRSLGTGVVVEAGRTTEVVWELSVGGAVAGATSASCAGTISWSIMEAGSASSWAVGGNLTLGPGEEYRIDGLRAGEYQVCFGACGCTSEPIPVVLGAVSDGVDAPAPPPDTTTTTSPSTTTTEAELPRTGPREDRLRHLTAAGILLTLIGGALVAVAGSDIRRR